MSLCLQKSTVFLNVVDVVIFVDAAMICVFQSGNIGQKALADSCILFMFYTVSHLFLRNQGCIKKNNSRVYLLLIIVHFTYS